MARNLARPAAIPATLISKRRFVPSGMTIVEAVDGFRDMPPPEPDRSHMTGNHVILECAAAWVLLGHLQQGTVEARAGQAVEVGQRLGRIGNSGNTGEPHLHIHAQRPGTSGAPFGGDPIPFRLDGRYLVRNSRVRMD